MAVDKKITELPDATLPIAAGVKFEAVQGGVNVKVDADDMPGSAGVTSVSGTADRITSTGGATPAIDISSTFEALLQKVANTATALTDGAAIAITGAKHTLTTDEATITFSQSFTGDFSNIDVTFNTTAATWTFPAGSLCVVEGAASGNNTATISAVSGDKIVISIWLVAASTYRVVVKNFGQ